MSNIDPEKQIDKEIGRIQMKPDIEIGSLGTNDLGTRCPPEERPDRKRASGKENMRKSSSFDDNALAKDVYGHLVRPTSGYQTSTSGRARQTSAPLGLETAREPYNSSHRQRGKPKEQRNSFLAMI